MYVMLRITLFYDEMSRMSYYFLLMLLMNLQIKLRNSLVMCVSVIEFSPFVTFAERCYV